MVVYKSKNAVASAYSLPSYEGGEDENRGGLLGGVGYLGEKLAVGAVQSIEGISDFLIGGAAKLFGFDKFAERQFVNDWFGDWYSHPDEWFNPSDSWKVAGDIAGGIGSSLPAMAAALGVTLATGGAGAVAGASFLTAGLGAAGNATKEAYMQTGKLTGKEFGYGALTGALEGGMESITNLIGLGTGAVIKSVGKSLGKEVAESAVRQGVGITLAKAYGGEAFEEAVSEIMSAPFKRLTYDKDAEFASAGEILYASFVGGMSGLVMGGGGTVFSAARNTARGAKLVEQGQTDQVLSYGKYLSEKTEQNGIDIKQFKQVESTYKKLSASLEKTNGEIKTVAQRRMLGELQIDNFSASVAPRMYKTATSIVSNPDMFIEKINAYGYTDANGKPITVTKEQLMQGIDEKNLKGTIPTALESNETLRNIVMMSMAGEMLMNTSKFQESVLRGEKFAGDADIENLLKQGKPEEIQAMQELIGLGDLHNVNPDAFNRKIAELEASGKLDELYNKYKAKTASTGAINAGENTSFASESANSALESANFVTDEKNRFALTNNKETSSLQTNENKSSKNAKNADKRLHIDKKNDIMISEKQINTQEFDHGTNRTNEFRRIQEESRGMSDEERSSYQNGSKKLDIEKRERLAVAFEKELSTSRSGESFNQSSLVNHRTGKNITMLENVDGSLFHDIFEVAKKYLHNGELVDLHDNYDNATCYISNDGLCGFAIEGNGNLVSVFNLGENGFLDTISEYVKNKGATHLDCYNSDIQPLTLMYERKLGFKTASIMDYNMEYDHDNIAKNHNMPKVAFMVNTNENVETKTFSKDEYDAAVAYQQSFVKDNKSNNSRTDLKETRKALPNEKKASSETENTQKKAGGEPGKSMTVIESATFAKENVPEYSQLNADDQARVRRLIRQAKANGFTDKQTRAYARVSARSGIDIVFDKERLYRGKDENTGEDVYADGLYSHKQNKIFINPEGSRSPARLLIHELTHALYNDRQSRVILDRGAKNLTEDQKKEIWNRYFPDAEYNENNIIFKDELSSHYTEALLDDDALLEKLCNDNPTLKDKILSFFKKAITGYSDEPNLSREAKKLYKRYKTLFDNFSVRNQYNVGAKKSEGEERYALIGRTEDGRGIYRSNYPENTPKDVKQRDIVNLVQSVWSKKPIKLNLITDGKIVPIEAKFNPELTERSDLSKIAFGNRKGTASEKRITMNLSSDLYQIAEESHHVGSKTETGKDNAAHTGVTTWHYFLTDLVYVEANGTEIECYMNIDVKQNDNGHWFYSFAIEKGSRPADVLSVVTDKSATTSNNSISQNSEKSTENAKKVSTNSSSRNALSDSSLDNNGNKGYNYTKEQYEQFGWAREADALTKTELDDLYSKIQARYTLRTFKRSSKGEAIVKVNNEPHTKLGVNNVFVFVKGTKNNFKISRVVRFDAQTEVEMEIYEEHLYEGRTCSDTYLELYKKEGYTREHRKENSPTFAEYRERRSDGEKSRGAYQDNRGPEEHGSGHSQAFGENGETNVRYALSDDDGGVHNHNKGSDKNGQNSRLLERRGISTSRRSENDIRKHSKNTRTLQGLLGLSDEVLRRHNIKAGETGWLEDYQGANGVGKPDDKQKARRFLQSVYRKLSGTKLKSTDTVGRKLPLSVLNKFADTVFKTEDGTILSLWHWTNEKFTEFKYGDIGFHAGTFDASHAIMFAKSEKGEKGFFKELYFNSKNPLFIDRDLMKWTPHLVSVYSGIFNDTEIAELSSLDGYGIQQYDSVASIRIREILKSKGYDSIIYTNDWEGGLSVIAFDNEQFYTVAENGVDAFNHSTERYALPDTDTDTDTVDTSDSVGKKRTQYKASIKERIFTAADSYSYDTLTKKNDLTVVAFPAELPMTEDGRVDTNAVVARGRLNARKQKNPNNTDERTYVHIGDIGLDVLLSKKGMVHGIARSQETAFAVMKIGDVLKNSVAVNELNGSATRKTEMSYVLLGACRDSENIYVVRSVVSKLENNVTEIDVYQLSAVKGKKTETPTSALGGTGVKEQNALVSSESPAISIADFLEYVKTIPIANEVFSEDVAKKIGVEHSKGSLSGDIRYALSDNNFDSASGMVHTVTKKTAKETIADGATAMKNGVIPAVIATQIQFTNQQAGIEYAGKKMGVKDIEKWTNNVRASRAQAQEMLGGKICTVRDGKIIDEGDGLGEILNPIKAKGEDYEHAFYASCYHAHNIDRMLLEKRSIERNKQNKQKLKDMQDKLNELKHDINTNNALLEKLKDSDNVNSRIETTRIREKLKSLKAEHNALNKATKKLKKTIDEFVPEANKPVLAKEINGEKVALTAEESQAILEEYDKRHPEFKQHRQKLYGYNDALMRKRVDAGLITEELYIQLKEKYPHYVPTFREQTEQGTSGISGKYNLAVKKTIGKARGSLADLMPLDKAIARMTEQTVTACNINKLVNVLVDASEAKGDTRYLEEVKRGKISLDESISKDGDDTEQDIPKTNQISAYRNGEKITYSVTPEVFAGFDAFNSKIDTASLPIKTLQWSTSVFKKLVTSLNPFFSVRNSTRDIQEAGVNTKYPKVFLKNYARAIDLIRTNSKLFQLYRAFGGLNNTVFDYEKGFTGIQNKYGFAKPDNKILSMLTAMERVNMFIEQIPRFAEFISSIEAGSSPEQAVLDAADVTTNFGRTGKITKALNSTVIPFLNPSIQGLSKITRNIRDAFTSAEAFGTFAIKLAIVGVIPQIVNYLFFKDDDDYEKLRDTDKENNYLFKVGDTFIKIPKGRVASVLAGLTNRTTQELEGKNADWKDYFDNVISQITPVENFARPIWQPVIDATNNKTWYGTKIEGQQFENTRPEDRYDESTSSIAIAMGKITKTSPKKWHYVIDQYSGIIGDILLPMTTPKAENDLIKGNFVLDPTTSNKLSTNFYKLYEEAQYKKTDGDIAAKYQVKYLNKVKKSINELYDQKAKIHQSDDLNNSEKLQQARIIQALINTLYQDVMDNYDSYTKAIAMTQGYYDEETEEDIRQAEITRIVYGSKQALKEYNEKVYEKCELLNLAGVDYDKLYYYYFSTKGLTSDTDKKGNVISGSKKKKVIAAVNALGVSREQMLLLIASKGYSLTDSEKKRLLSYILKLKTTKEKRIELAELCGFTVKNGKIVADFK